MATAREIVSAGYLDRMISRLSTIGKGQIDRTQAGYLTAVRKGREQSPYDVRGSYAGWREVAEEARLAVNRARRLTGGGDRGPPPSSLTVAGDPDGARATRSEYHVLVEVRDPEVSPVPDDGGGLKPARPVQAPESSRDRRSARIALT